MNFAVVTTIAGLEVRQRIRSTRWKWTLAILFLLISMLILGTLYLTVVIAEQRYALWADYLFDYTLGLVLFLGLAAAPTMSATSINGDRRDATLALVQATPISSLELTLGKLLGSWLASLALIAVALPYLLWGLFTGPTSALAGVLGIVVTALLLGCYCGLGLGFSALTTRPAASAMLTQATVLLLLVGLPIVFGMTTPLLGQDHQVRQAQIRFGIDGVRECDDSPRTKSVIHTERTWWLLLPNPVLVVTDAVASGVDREPNEWVNSAASLPALGQSMARSGANLDDLRCSQLPVNSDYRTVSDLNDRHDSRYIGHSWYLGLLANLALGALGVWVAIRRLRVPARHLPKGVRVA